ncbi:MAG: ABC transporter ATP-binding protein [Puniceicoccaceae bacterium]
MAEPVLKVKNLCHLYGKAPSLRGVSFNVEEGETVCLLGPSGCGKTTTLRLLAGLEAPSEGTIEIDGQMVSEGNWMTAPEKRPIGMLFQDFALFPHLTVEKNIRFGLRKLDEGERARRVEDALKLVGVEELRKRYPHTLSGGQQQRVALARAMALEPKCLLLDEPFSGLDATLRYAVREETRLILQRKGIASVVVTHDAEEAMHLADRIILMRNGRIEQDDGAEVLYFEPKSAFVARFFGDVERFIGLSDGQGKVRSPLGVLRAARPLGPGPVEILVRRQGFRFEAVEDLEDHLEAPRFDVLVEDSKLIGGRRESRCRIGSKGEIRFRALHRATTHLERGKWVPCVVDPRMTFIFPVVETVGSPVDGL